MLRLFVFISIFIMSQNSNAKVVTQRVEYKDGDAVLEGYLARDDKFKGPRPAILIVHEWMGLGDYSERRAKEMAELGYVAFAADIYGKGLRPKDRSEAGQFAGKYKGDRPLLRSRVRAALETLKTQKGVDTKKIGAMGYCFGGTTVLELARSGADVKGVVSFHGGLDTPNPSDTANFKGRVLVLHGAIDPNVPMKDVEAFMKEMNEAKVDYQFVTYPGAAHSFTNPAAGNDPSKGAAYNEVADKRSFKAMTEFFKEIL
jgi:dienelactone hydrolase